MKGWFFLMKSFATMKKVLDQVFELALSKGADNTAVEFPLYRGVNVNIDMTVLDNHVISFKELAMTRVKGGDVKVSIGPNVIVTIGLEEVAPVELTDASVDMLERFAVDVLEGLKTKIHNDRLSTPEGIELFLKEILAK